MRVLIGNQVQQKIEEFYSISMALHPTLDEEIVEKKKNRLYDAIFALADYARIYPLARVKQSWVNAGYREMICEDFHFAFDIVDLDTSETIVYVYDAEHSYLNY